MRACYKILKKLSPRCIDIGIAKMIEKRGAGGIFASLSIKWGKIAYREKSARLGQSQSGLFIISQVCDYAAQYNSFLRKNRRVCRVFGS